MQIVSDKKELISLINNHQKDIKAFGVNKLGIFGSFARNEASERSDIDFFIDFIPEHKTLKNFVGLASFLKNLTGRKVEIVTLQSLNKFTGKYILEQVEYVAFAA